MTELSTLGTTDLEKPTEQQKFEKNIFMLLRNPLTTRFISHGKDNSALLAGIWEDKTGGIVVYAHRFPYHDGRNINLALAYIPPEEMKNKIRTTDIYRYLSLIMEMPDEHWSIDQSHTHTRKERYPIDLEIMNATIPNSLAQSALTMKDLIQSGVLGKLGIDTFPGEPITNFPYERVNSMLSSHPDPSATITKALGGYFLQRTLDYRILNDQKQLR